MGKMHVAVIFSLALLSVIVCDDIPEECKHPPAHPHRNAEMRCCTIPDIIKMNDLADCDIPGKPLGDHPRGGNGPPNRFPNGTHAPPPCEPAICVLNKLKILNADNKVDAAAVTAYFDRLVAANYSDWQTTFKMIAKECTENLNLYGPDGFCEPIKFGHCYFMNSFENCPSSSWMNTDECNEWKAFMEKCGKPAFKKS